MFCPKCGAKAPDDAVFCQQCGAKLNLGDTAQPTVDSPAIPTKQASGASGGAPKKKKKLPIIIGAIVLLVVIIVAASLAGGGGERDNVTTVQAHKPFATSQNLPYTFAEVFDKYTNNPVWYTDSEDEKTNTAIVKVDGIVKGTDCRLIVSIEVSPNPDNPDGCIIHPQSVNFDGTESPSQNDAVEFLYNMFAAYDKGYEDLSELLSSSEGSVNTELSQVYTNEDMGISFQYPSDWELFEVGGMSVSITHNTAGHTVAFEVVNTLQPNPFGIFTDDKATIEAAVSQSGNTTVQSIEDATISGIPVRVLNYRTGGLNGTEPVVVRNCYYINGDDAYLITCSCSESTADAYQELFDAILDSCTITPVETVTPSQGTDETEPPQDNQPPTATTGFVGLWQDASGACLMEISDADGDGIYTIDATQDLSDGEWREWSLDGYSEEGNGIFYSGVYVDLYLRDDGTVGGGGAPNDAAGVVFLTDDGILHWVSDTGELDSAIDLTRN